MARIVLNNVSVDFPIYDGNDRSFRRALLELSVGGVISRRGRGHLEVRALDDISLGLVDGDRVGLIGHNGAGKSTLLRILAGIREPTAGRIVIEGSVGALLNMPSVLDPEMTGHENIDRACILLGIPDRRRDAVAEDVVTFCELGPFLDLPVRAYSAGMQLRLSFALMTAQQPEILLLDEAFSAGDAHFRVRAEDRMSELGRRTDIVIFASHDYGALRRMCNKAVWLEHGRIRALGPIEEVLTAYAQASGDGGEPRDECPPSARSRRFHHGRARPLRPSSRQS